jgi:hypothetical protein
LAVTGKRRNFFWTYGSQGYIVPRAAPLP